MATIMHFKEPRDPNTQNGVLVIRKVDASENIRCMVGSGECQNLAVEVHDGGGDGDFYVCAEHLPEVYALSKLIAEMTPNQMNQFKSLVDTAHKTP